MFSFGHPDSAMPISVQQPRFAIAPTLRCLFRAKSTTTRTPCLDIQLTLSRHLTERQPSLGLAKRARMPPAASWPNSKPQFAHGSLILGTNNTLEPVWRAILLIGAITIAGCHSRRPDFLERVREDALRVTNGLATCWMRSVIQDPLKSSDRQKLSKMMLTPSEEVLIGQGLPHGFR